MSMTPKLRFPKFTNGWEDKIINELCNDIFLGLTTKVDYVEEDGVPLIRAGDIASGVLKFDNVRYISKEQHKKLTKYHKAKKGNVLVSKSGTLGTCCIVNTDIEFSIYESIIVLDTNDKLENKYLLQILQDEKTQSRMLGQKVGGTVGHLNLKNFKELKINLPSVPEQTKIANFLSKVDEYITTQEKTVSSLEEQKKGLMQKLFSQEIRFKDSIDCDYPDWEEKTIGDICEFFNGKAHEKNIVDIGDYIVVNSKFISTDGNVKKYSNEAVSPLLVDDIVMVMSDVPNGKAMSKCFLIDEDDKYTLNQRICALRTTQNTIFFLYQINRNRYFLQFDDGVKQTNLRKDDVLSCPVNVPCIEEQEKIANCLSKMDELIENEKQTLDAWKQLKKGLLQQMFL